MGRRTAIENACSRSRIDASSHTRPRANRRNASMPSRRCTKRRETLLSDAEETGRIADSMGVGVQFGRWRPRRLDPLLSRCRMGSLRRCWATSDIRDNCAATGSERSRSSRGMQRFVATPPAYC